jgi:alpha-glucuronidase
MATPEQIMQVRVNTNTVSDTVLWTDTLLGGLIDAHGVNEASAQVWEAKAASYAELVDVSEAGASRKMSDLHKHALTMAKTWRDKDAVLIVESTGRAKVHPIGRL